jgi:hypothetical protein
VNHVIPKLLTFIFPSLVASFRSIVRPSFGDLCERPVGTVFQLPNPDAIYSRGEGKERRWLPSHVVCVLARSTHC